MRRERPADAPRVMFWGTYDLSKPRNRILISGLRANGVEVVECHASVWEQVRDKGTLRPLRIAGHLARAGLAYPRLIARFCKAAAPDVVVVGYLGQLDVLLLYPFARLRGVPVIWDQFISLYDAVVHDRKKLTPRHPLAQLLYAWEWLACRAATSVLMDTRAHAAYVAETFGLAASQVESVWVGAETDVFPPVPPEAAARTGSLVVVFYGQFIPLHGLDTIIRAARILEHRPVRFVLLGSGQEEARVRELLSEHPLSQLEWHPWVEYDRLIEFMARAHVCLGIFGASGKASRVIPNKVFQIVAARRPLITRDSPAIRELFGSDTDGVRLIPAADPIALADALSSLLDDPESLLSRTPRDRSAEISAQAVGRQLLDVIARVRRRAGRRGAEGRHGREPAVPAGASSNSA